MHAGSESQKSYHNHISEKYLLLADWTFRNHLRDSDDEVTIEQLTAVVDVMFIPHNDPKIS